MFAYADEYHERKDGHTYATVHFPGGEWMYVCRYKGTFAWFPDIVILDEHGTPRAVTEEETAEAIKAAMYGEVSRHSRIDTEKELRLALAEYEGYYAGMDWDHLIRDLSYEMCVNKARFSETLADYLDGLPDGTEKVLYGKVIEDTSTLRATSR